MCNWSKFKFANFLPEKQNNVGISQRTCKVPAGKALFIPVMTVEESDKESPGASDQDLNKSATTDQDSVNSLYLIIDDAMLHDSLRVLVYANSKQLARSFD
jgi:hypothetical protein